MDSEKTLQAEMAKDDRTLSTHILDTSLGKAAAELPVSVYRLLDNQQWQQLKQTTTDRDGRCAQLLAINDFQSGIYKLKFDVEKYYSVLGAECFYPFIEIVVKCAAVIILETCGLFGILSLIIKIPLVAIYLLVISFCCGVGTGVMTTIGVVIYPTNLRAMAVCISLMLGRSGCVAGSILMGDLIETNCAAALCTASTALKLAGC